MAFRAGLEQVPLSTNDTAINITTGLGIKNDGFSYDYAFCFDNTLSANSTHYFTISYAPPEEKRPATNPAPNKEVKEVEPIKKEKKEEEKQPPLFPDVPKDYWAREAIEALAQANIINGLPDGSYQPEKNISRAELSTLLIKSQGIKPAQAETEIFKDIPSHHWAREYIGEAAKQGLVNGYPDKTFQPNNGINREEAIKVNVEYDQLPKEEGPAPFSDIAQQRWSAKYISAAKKQRWLDYIKADYFQPKRDFTRAEAAYILYKTSFIEKKLLP
ncbi:hypothetical protein A2548_00960 [candidate division WOR-1 bacterium RIFOXYD2_FULL_41_8]|nr:MAG: hypothetical protein A2548_00960 [candidate division WOR-1 bacterium RIFOXYD2_FULL_41_8]